MIDKRFLLTGSLLIIILFAVIYLFSRFFGALPLSINSVVTNKSDVFSSTGNGRSTVAPDQATIRVGVQSNGETVKQAQDDLNTQINKVSEAIKNLGVKSEDIKTENYNITPNIDYSGSEQKITGFSASSNISVTLKDINKVNQVIDVSTANGANLVGGVTFDVSDNTQAVNKAREEAVKEAKENAQNAAKVAGFSLGKLINYNEYIPQSPQPYNMALGGSEMSKSVQVPTDIQPGTNEINITVTLSYEIR